MSFLNIDDINKRNKIVSEYPALEKKIKLKDRSEIMEEKGRDRELTKFFKPVTARTEQLEKSLTEEIGKIPKALEKSLPSPSSYTASLPLPSSFTQSFFSNFKELHPELENTQLEKNKLLTLQKTGDEEIILTMNNVPLNIEKNKIIVGNYEYEKTPQLMQLIFSNVPPDFKEKDFPKEFYKFKEILNSTGVLFETNEKGKLIINKNLSKGKKWTDLLRPIKDEILQSKKSYKKKKGKGHTTVFLSSDPIALADRLTLLCGSVRAGNTGLKNEIADICNELIRKK